MLLFRISFAFILCSSTLIRQVVPRKVHFKITKTTSVWENNDVASSVPRLMLASHNEDFLMNMLNKKEQIRPTGDTV